MANKLSLREAAKLCGRGKSTIAAALADGRLAADRNEQGGYEIDPAELHRVFPLKVDSATGQFIEQRTPRDAKRQVEDQRPLASLALSRPSSRPGRAGGALAQAEVELREALVEVERVKQEAERQRIELEKDARHAAELAQVEVRRLVEALNAEREAKADLKAAHEAHLGDLRRELEQVKAMLPSPDAPQPRKGIWARITGR